MERERTIQQLLEKGVKILEKSEILNPILDVELLLCYALNVDKIYVYTHRHSKIETENVDKFLSLVNKRKKGYPIQYIIGKQEFMGLEFYVNEGVLVPRPDTEILIEWIIEIIESGYFKEKESINILDIGTGSGAISLSLAYYIDKAYIYTVDISNKALSIAKKNAKNLNLKSKVRFLEGNIFEPIGNLDEKTKFDIIVSNPPYIPTEEINSLQKEVSKYEPRLALDGGLDGLDFYRKITKESPKYLNHKGILAFEIGYNQGDELKKILETNRKYKDIQIRKDLGGHNRAVIGYITN